MTPQEITTAKFEAMESLARDQRLTSAEVRLGIVLLGYFNAKYDCAWPSRDTLAQDLGVCCSTVTRAAKGLEAKGYFAVQWNKGRGHSNRYYPAFVCQQDGAEKGASVRPFTADKKDASVHEKDASSSLKGRNPVTKRAHPCDKTPSKNTSMNPSKNPSTAQPLASPPEGGSRLLDKNQNDGGRPEEVLQDTREQAEGGDHPEAPDLRLPLLGVHVNDHRPPKKDSAYWKQHADMREAAKLNPADRQAFWNRKNAEDDEARASGSA